MPMSNFSDSYPHLYALCCHLEFGRGRDRIKRKAKIKIVARNNVDKSVKVKARAQLPLGNKKVAARINTRIGQSVDDVLKVRASPKKVAASGRGSILGQSIQGNTSLRLKE